MNRRSFITALTSIPILSQVSAGASARRPVAVGSANSERALETVMRSMREGTATLDAVVAGISEVEDDPSDQSVGYGGLPNEHGVVELDASVMDGPTHSAGAVAALQRIRNPAQVALQVMRRTDHVLLVGDGALAFARACGFEEQDLLTEDSRRAWLKWKANLNRTDDWLDDDQRDVPHTDGTVHISAVNTRGEMGACTSTSGLSYKLGGRVGDSPIVGAGMFVDNEVGSAGSTGRGEAVITSSASFAVVRHMADGLDPTEACLRVLTWIADHTRRKHLLNDRGEPNYQVTMYALRNDGAYGVASLREGKKYAVHDGTSARTLDCPYLFKEKD